MQIYYTASGTLLSAEVWKPQQSSYQVVQNVENESAKHLATADIRPCVAR